MGTINLFLPKADLPLNMKYIICLAVNTGFATPEIVLILLLVLINSASLHEIVAKDLFEKLISPRLRGCRGACWACRAPPAVSGM